MNEESLFHEALARPAADRPAFLARSCAGRPDVYAAIEALLVAHDGSGEFLVGAPIAQLIESDAPAMPETNNQAFSTDPESRNSGWATADAGGTTQTSPTGPPPSQAVEPDLIDRYVIREELGRGGMGTVYLAHDPALDRLVALKVPQVSGPGAGERLLREARAAAQLNHPNLCPVYDAGRADGLLYLAMAYVPGDTLAQVLKRDGCLSSARAAAIAAGVARGMAEVHRHGIVHRDLKPGNILFDRRGEPVVTDFGLALRGSTADRAADPGSTVAHDPRLTQAGAVVGTPAYMPPEQAAGDQERIGPASDVYALGAILFEMLSGSLPFKGETVAETLRKIETDLVPPLPGVPAKLAAVCRHALARDPTDRFATMDGFAEALAAFASDSRRRWGRMALAAAALVLLVAVGTVIYVKTDRGTIEVRLSEPAADVRVEVDGEIVRVTDGNRVTRLRTGNHTLVVTGPDFETETQEFRVKRGEKSILTITLRTKEPGNGGSLQFGRDKLTPARLKLANLLTRGKRMIDDERLADLGTVADEANLVDPESPGALALRATFRLAVEQDFRGARSDVEAALRLNPETYQALLVRAHLHSMDRKSEEAIADETVALRLDPNHPTAWAKRAKSYLDRKDIGQAIHDATRAIDRKMERPDGRLNRSSAYALLGDYPKALADADVAVEMCARRHDPIALIQRAGVRRAAGDAAGGDADWEKAKKIDPKLGPDDQIAFPAPPEPPTRKELTPAQAADLAAALKAAEDAWAGGRLGDCGVAVDRACQIDPTSGPAVAWRAQIRIQRGEVDRTIEDVKEALRLQPDQARAYLARGWARAAKSEFAAGIADLTVSLRLDRDNPSTWNNRGVAYLRRGQYHQAISDLLEAVRLHDRADIQSNLGECYLHLGDNPKAAAAFARAAELQPSNPRWLLIYAAVRQRLGDSAGAQRAREQAIKIDGNAVDMPAVQLPAPLPPAKNDPESD
jgi:tetratricopeptide (TPR) repeat protein